MLIRITPAASTPVSLAEAYAQLSLHLVHDAHLKDMVEVMIADATSAVEKATGLSLAPAVFEDRYDAWPNTCGLELRTAPVRDVTGVTYLDAAGIEQALPMAGVTWAPTDESATVQISGSSPALTAQLGAVRVRYEAGFNDPADAGGEAQFILAPEARRAVLICVASWFKDRESGDMPDAAMQLCDLIRIFR